MRKIRFYTFYNFLKSLLRPLYRKISFETRAKDDSTLVWLSPSLRSDDKPHTRARINTFALVSKYTIITEASTILTFPLKHHFALEKNFSGFRMCGFGVYGISMRGVGMCGTGGCGVWLWDRGVTVQHVGTWSVWGYDVRVWVLFTRMCKFWVWGVWVPLLSLR